MIATGLGRMLGAEPMAAADATFLFLEAPGLPMHVAGLAILDPARGARGPIRPEELRERVRERLPLLPSLRRRPLAIPFDLGRPLWLADPEFDLDRHLSFHRLPPRAGHRHLLALAARLHAQPLPRRRPLWEMTLIDGLPGGRQALLTRLHHALADGIAGVETVATIFDGPPVTPNADRTSTPRARPAFGRETDPGPAPATAAGIVRHLARGPLVPPGPFNGRVGPRRAFATADLPMDLIEQVRGTLGGTIDDVALAAVMLGLDRHLRRAGAEVAGRRLRVMLPVAIPGLHDGSANRVSAIFVDLRLGRPPAECLDQVRKAKAAGRRWHEATALATALAGVEFLAAPVQATLARALARLPFAHLIVSDVPGLPEPPRLLGAPLIGAYPLLPLAPCLGLSLGMLTVGRTMGLGVVADPDLVPRAATLARDVVVGLVRLAAAGRRG
ncbi:MAG TPA: wax ester/triacylglycerol synthase domain-containing protein [Candidatus Dormibacteraeota bacterium]|nr:wax ester/triacylglycerol synthase domain-containing protein [Candidatus Dormibacteraeota bacterium]